MTDFRSFIRDVPDFPTPGHPLSRHHAAARVAGGVRARRSPRWRSRFAARAADKILGIEARGFHVRRRRSRASSPSASCRCASPASCRARPSAMRLRPRVREGQPRGPRGRLPPGERVLIVDDVLATGGTAEAAAEPRGAPRRARSSASRVLHRARRPWAAARGSGGRAGARRADAIIRDTPRRNSRHVWPPKKSSSSTTTKTFC